MWPVMLAFYTGTGLVLATSLPMRLHANTPEKTVENGPRASATNVRDSNAAPGFGSVQPWPFQTHEESRADGRIFHLPLFCNSDFQTNINLFLKKKKSEFHKTVRCFKSVF